MQQPVDLVALGDALVDAEVDVRRVAQRDLAPQLAADETLGRVQGLQALLLPLLVLEDADIHPGMAQVVVRLHAGDGDEAQPRVAQVVGDDLAHHPLDLLGHLGGALEFHIDSS